MFLAFGANTFDDEITSVLAFEDPCVFITHKHNKGKYMNKEIDEKMCTENTLFVVSINKYIKRFMELYPEFKYEDVRSTPLMILELMKFMIII